MGVWCLVDVAHAPRQRDEEVSELTKRQAEELRLKATDSERWEKQTRALDTELKALDSQLQQHHRKHDVAIETLKTDKDAVVVQFEHKRQEQQSSAVQLVTQNRELELQVAQMAVQISESRVIVADTQEEATQLEAMLRESERWVHTPAPLFPNTNKADHHGTALCFCREAMLRTRTPARTEPHRAGAPGHP